MKTALIIVDVQKDFMPSGKLPVPNGDLVIPAINWMMENMRFDYIVATQDYHPKRHKSFASSHPGRDLYETIRIPETGLSQVLWPDHCVKGTVGANIHPDLKLPDDTHIFPKGTNKLYDSYSGFKDDGGIPTGLGNYLKDVGVEEVYIVGLTTDYCVQFTALDAKKLGFNTIVVDKACRAVDESIVKDVYEILEGRGIWILKGGQFKNN